MIERPSVGGSLFPSAFLASIEAFDRSDDQSERRRSVLARWWRSVEGRCGPATAVRTLFDVAAMPLAALLGFRAADAQFDPRVATARLYAGGTRNLLVVLPWSSRLPAVWRDLHAHHDAQWALVIALPFVSVVDLRRRAVRHSLDFRFPHVLHPRSVNVFLQLADAAAFEDGGAFTLRDLADRATRYQAAVRQDLQVGVTVALGRLMPCLRGQSFDESLVIVYRLLFLLFAESRHLTAAGGGAAGDAYGLSAISRKAWRDGEVRGLWSSLAAITRLSRAGCQSRSLIVAPFNGHLFAREAAPSLELEGRVRQPTVLSSRRDSALGDALVALASRDSAAGREEISYADLGVEQLGAVYERVLDLDPSALIDRAERAAAPVARRHSARRKEHGTFYTPQALAEYVVRRTLAPLVRDRRPDDILRLRVLDPAMGSGAFLVAACRYLADAYERALIEEGRYGAGDFDEARHAEVRRLVASRCLVGVDVNPTAVQLARLSLWLTTLAKGKPLSFLDHQLRVGNSLIGTTPADLWRARRHVASRSDHPLFQAAGLEEAVRDVLAPVRDLRLRADDTVNDVHARERLWRSISGPSSPVARWRTACDIWCSQWFQADGEATPSAAEIRAVLDALLRNDHVLSRSQFASRLTAAAAAASRERFFHWPLEFPDVFHDAEGAAASTRGFDAVIGNPPWEMLRRGDGTSRSRSAELAFIRESGFFPACDRGHLNLYQPFVERALALVRPGGRVGLVLPWSFATDDGSAALRQHIVRHGSMESLLGIDNGEGLFPIHRGLRFAALVIARTPREFDVSMRAGIKSASEIEALPDTEMHAGTGARSAPGPSAASADAVAIPPATLRLVGGPALRIPDVRSRRDLEWLARVARTHPPLGAQAGWGISFGRELNATEDGDAFGSEGLPVLDGKHIEQFTVTIPPECRRIPMAEAGRRLPDRRFTRRRLAYRDVSGVGNRHTVIAAIIPAGVVTTHTLFCLRQTLDDERQAFLCGLLNSRSVNAWVRMFMGSHVTTSLLEQLPAAPWTGTPAQRVIAALATQLIDGAADAGASALRSELDERVARLYAVGI